jgi:hypothetical protein
MLINPTNFRIIVDFKSLLNARFPSSLQTCQLRFQVQKLGANFATKFASTFQCLNYCKQMFIAQVEINNSMESSWSNGLPRFVLHWIGYYYWVWTFVYKRSSNIEMNLRALFRSSRPIPELGNVIGKFATNLDLTRFITVLSSTATYLNSLRSFRDTRTGVESWPPATLSITVYTK